MRGSVRAAEAVARGAVSAIPAKALAKHPSPSSDRGDPAQPYTPRNSPGETASFPPPSAAPASSASAPVQPAPTAGEARPDPRPDTRLAAQVEAAAEQLSHTRETQRNLRPEVTLRHGEFGLVNLRLEGSADNLRATLTARDPGFVPAVRQALVERGAFERIGPSAEPVPQAGPSITLRFPDAAGAAAWTSGQSQGQPLSQASPQASPQGGAGTGNGGQNSAGAQHASAGGSAAQATDAGGYGSSPGSGQGSSQPYFAQSGDEGRDAPPPADDPDGRGPPSGPGLGRSGGRGAGLYA
jgi:hypothetical protein